MKNLESILVAEQFYLLYIAFMPDKYLVERLFKLTGRI